MRPRSRSAGCSNAGRAARPSRRRLAIARRRSGGRPIAPRRRSQGSRARSGAICSSSRPNAARVGRGTASPERRSSASGRPSSTAPACASRRFASRRLTSSCRCSCVRWRGSRTPPGSTPSRTAPRSGPGCSTCARTCSAARSRTCARLRPERPSLTVVGSVNLDLVGRCERLPRPGETVTGATFERHAGGKGANQAVAAARLGADVSFVGAVGDDDFAREALAGLEAAEVRLDVQRRGTTGIALIVVAADGENEIVVVPGANGELEGVTASGNVLCQLEIPLDVVAANAEAADFFCLNAAPARTLPATLLERTGLLVVNRYELDALGHEPRGLVALTLGAEGAVLLEGRGHDEALTRACAAGAIAASRRGAQPSLPTAAEVDATLAAA